jgi:hypothetical protein
MDGLVRLWSMTALEAARRSEQTRVKPTQTETSLPAVLGKAGAWSRWMARREADANPAPIALSSADGATA